MQSKNWRFSLIAVSPPSGNCAPEVFLNTSLNSPLFYVHFQSQAVDPPKVARENFNSSYRLHNTTKFSIYSSQLNQFLHVLFRFCSKNICTNSDTFCCSSVSNNLIGDSSQYLSVSHWSFDATKEKRLLTSIC